MKNIMLENMEYKSESTRFVTGKGTVLFLRRFTPDSTFWPTINAFHFLVSTFFTPVFASQG
jgi:hypothetical protein